MYVNSKRTMGHYKRLGIERDAVEQTMKVDIRLPVGYFSKVLLLATRLLTCLSVEMCTCTSRRHTETESSTRPRKYAGSACCILSISTASDPARGQHAAAASASALLVHAQHLYEPFAGAVLGVLRPTPDSRSVVPPRI